MLDFDFEDAWRWIEELCTGLVFPADLTDEMIAGFIRCIEEDYKEEEERC